jgi:pimeloyl-ACP methyl ester carboxylesterase
MAGYRASAFFLFNMMGPFRAWMKYYYAHVICSDPRFPEMMDRDLSRTTLESFLLSIASLRRTDLRPLLDQIKVPAMGIYGDRDKVVHPKQWEPMKKGIPHAHIERFPLAGHFPMLEEPKNFSERLKSFLDQDEPVPSPRPSTSLSPTPSVTL